MNTAAARYVVLQIRLRRRIAGLTASELALASGIAAEQMERIEAGRAALTWADLTRIASALDCEVSTLLDGTA